MIAREWTSVHERCIILVRVDFGPRAQRSQEYRVALATLKGFIDLGAYDMFAIPSFVPMVAVFGDAIDQPMLAATIFAILPVSRVALGCIALFGLESRHDSEFAPEHAMRKQSLTGAPERPLLLPACLSVWPRAPGRACAGRGRRGDGCPVCPLSRRHRGTAEGTPVAQALLACPCTQLCNPTMPVTAWGVSINAWESSRFSYVGRE